jgi:methanethiol S-methyltransferase
MNIFWLTLSILLWGFLHTLSASLRFKAFVLHAFGPGINRFYRLVYNLFAGISFVAVLVVAALTPDQTLYIVPFPWVILMILGEFMAVAALIAGFLQTDALDFLGLKQIASLQPKRPLKLVTGGLYRYVRHPLYSAGMLFIWLMPLMTVRVLVIDLALTVYVVVGAYFEERKLRREFGQDYVDYVAVTPMFIPFLKKPRNRTSI